MKKIENKTFVFCCIILFYLSYSGGVTNILTWDIFGQYMYLPMMFHKHQLIYSNLDYFTSINEVYHNSDTLYQFGLQENGNYIPRPTIGWAVLLSPFYFLAKIITPFTSYKNDGFSLPYQFIISLGVSIYMILGLYYLKKILRYFFTPFITSIALICLVLGTNFLYMNYAAKGSSNNVVFSIVAFMIWQTIRFHQSHKKIHAIGVGVSIGLIGIVRAPDILLAMIPVFWNYKNYGSWLDKIKFYLKEQKKNVLIILILSISILFIQFIYWKITTGHLIINSYGDNVGEGFDWFHPYTLEVLFSFRKGWLIYTPIMLFSIIGFFIWSKKQSENKTFPFIIFFVFLYVISSWTTWWYATSFSQRALIDIYPLLMISFGYTLTWMFDSKNKVAISLTFVFICLNLFQTYQIEHGIIDGSRMTKEYYSSVFLQTKAPTEKQKDLLIVDRIGKFYSGFDNQEKYKICYHKKHPFNKKTILNSKSIFSPAIDLDPKTISEKDHFWLRIKYQYKGEESSIEGKFFTAAVLYYKNGKGYGYVAKDKSDKLLKIDVIKHEITQDYLSPEFRTSKDKIRVCAYYQSGEELELTSVEIIGYVRK